MTRVEIKKTILKVIDFYGELNMDKLIEEMQIRGVKETDTRHAFDDMINEGVLDVNYERKVIVGNANKGSKYLD